MTRKEAIEVLNMVEAHGLADEAKQMAIQALHDIEQIRGIINAPVHIQEDVMRYKMICEVINNVA